jgi:hypothetical protein
LLAVALGAIVLACIFLGLELYRYGGDASAPSAAVSNELLPATPIAVALAETPTAGFGALVPLAREINRIQRA